MQSKGWWQIICEQHPEQHSDAWLNILKEFTESNEYGQEYDYWLDSFPRLYQLAYWLKEYVNLFEDIRFRNMHELNSSRFLKPSCRPGHAGQGWIAPAIDRTMKIGVNLVVRRNCYATKLLIILLHTRWFYASQASKGNCLMRLTCG